MADFRTWACGLIALVVLAASASLEAQTTRRPGLGMARRYQQSQQQRAKQFQQYQKSFSEWRAKADAAALKQQAERRAELARRKSKVEADRLARSEKIKQQNVAAAKSHDKPEADSQANENDGPLAGNIDVKSANK